MYFCWTNEYPNIFVAPKFNKYLHIWIYLSKNIQMFKFIQIFVALQYKQIFFTYEYICQEIFKYSNLFEYLSCTGKIFRYKNLAPYFDHGNDSQLWFQSFSHLLDQQGPTSKINCVQGYHLSRLCRTPGLQPAVWSPAGNANGSEVWLMRSGVRARWSGNLC